VSHQYGVCFVKFFSVDSFTSNQVFAAVSYAKLRGQTGPVIHFTPVLEYPSTGVPQYWSTQYCSRPVCVHVCQPWITYFSGWLSSVYFCLSGVLPRRHCWTYVLLPSCTDVKNSANLCTTRAMWPQCIGPPIVGGRHFMKQMMNQS